LSSSMAGLAPTSSEADKIHILAHADNGSH